MTKCDGCYERVAVGIQPIFVTSYPLRCRHLRGAGHQPAVLAISTVVLVSAELIGRLLFCNLHMTVGWLLLVLSQLAMEGRKEEVDRLLGEFLLPWAERFCEPMCDRSALSAWLTVKRSSIWNTTAAIFAWPALRPALNP